MKAFTGFFTGLVVLAVMVGLLTMTTSVEPANPGALVPGWMFMALLVGGVVFVLMCWGGRVNLSALLLVAVAVAGLIWLNGTDAMPGEDNPCPGDEVVIAVNGQCYGMDADANRAALDRLVAP